MYLLEILEAKEILYLHLCYCNGKEMSETCVQFIISQDRKIIAPDPSYHNAKIIIEHGKKQVVIVWGIFGGEFHFYF